MVATETIRHAAALCSRSYRECTVDVECAEALVEGSWIAIRGSDDPLDWARNLDTTRVPLGWGTAHRGFVRRAERLIRALQPEGPVDLCGHSLGGAAAYCMAAILGPEVVGRVVTFGAPRPGDAGLARYLEQNFEHVRVIAHGDPVAVVPPWLSGWRHPGPMLRVSRGGAWRWSPPWWKRLLEVARHPRRPIDAHSMGSYEAAVGPVFGRTV